MRTLASSVAAHAVLTAQRGATIPFRITHFALPLAAFVALMLLFASTSIDVNLAHAWAYDDALQVWVGRATLVGRRTAASRRTRCDPAGHPRAAWHARNRFLLGASARRASDRGVCARHDRAQLGSDRRLEARHECSVPLGSTGFRRPAARRRVVRDETTRLRAGGVLPRSTFSVRILAFRLLFRFQGSSTPAGQGGTLGRAGRRRHFAFGQEARGAHFLSHDICSAFVAWFVALATYSAWVQRPTPMTARNLAELPQGTDVDQHQFDCGDDQQRRAHTQAMTCNPQTRGDQQQRPAAGAQAANAWTWSRMLDHQRLRGSLLL